LGFASLSQTYGLVGTHGRVTDEDQLVISAQRFDPALVLDQRCTCQKKKSPTLG